MTIEQQVNVSHHIHVLHDKMRIYNFWLYLSQMLMDFASIWVILKIFPGP